MSKTNAVISLNNVACKDKNKKIKSEEAWTLIEKPKGVNIIPFWRVGGQWRFAMGELWPFPQSQDCELYSALGID